MYLRSISVLCNSISLINFNIFACYNFYLFISMSKIDSSSTYINISYLKKKADILDFDKQRKIEYEVKISNIHPILRKDKYREF